MGMRVDSNLKLDAKDLGNLQLSASVAASLREQIISGRIKKGEFLRIDLIAKALNVSSTPVREGLLMLQSEAFVKLIPRRGFVVNSFSKEDLVDLFWAQATVGAELAARAARKMSRQDLDKLKALHDAHAKAVDAGEDVTKLGHEFHRLINLAAESPRLAMLLGSLVRQLPNRFYASIEGHLASTVEYHSIILNAMRVQDEDAVRSLMFRHIMTGAENLIATLERSGTWGPAPVPEANAQPADAGISTLSKQVSAVARSRR
jgi:DNA-binding GntR family transcriptional regulator